MLTALTVTIIPSFCVAYLLEVDTARKQEPKADTNQ
jgi:hypothetical protein